MSSGLTVTAMRAVPEASQPSPEYLRRIREFQTFAREAGRPARRAEVSVPARAPLSGRDAEILARLRSLSPALADSLDQALRDLNDETRLSYMGPAGEIREVMRAAIQLLAPDAEVRKQAWFKGVQQGNKMNPTQAERTRYAIQRQRGSEDHARELDGLIDQSIAKIARETYAAGSSALHAGAAQMQVRKLTGWVFAVLDEVLPER
ncbi:pPIWI-associating nuclease domain-containing protein [Microbacterium sp. JZ101]